MSALWLILQALFVVALLLMALPVAVFVLEIGLALLGRRDQDDVAGARPPLAVLVPAHNEGVAILPTLASIFAQLQPGDRVLVVADNCSDDTAMRARHAGA